MIVIQTSNPDALRKLKGSLSHLFTDSEQQEPRCSYSDLCRAYRDYFVETGTEWIGEQLDKLTIPYFVFGGEDQKHGIPQEWNDGILGDKYTLSSDVRPRIVVYKDEECAILHSENGYVVVIVPTRFIDFVA